MNPGNPWGNFYGQLPPTSQQYDAPMSHIPSGAGLPSLGGGLPPARPVVLPPPVGYAGAPGNLYIEPSLGPQQPYKSVIVSQPSLNLQSTPAYSLPGINEPGKNWGSCHTVDASVLGLSTVPPPAHSGHTQLSPGLYKTEQPTVISAAHQSHPSTPVHSGYQEPRVNQSPGYNSPIPTSAPVVSQQSTFFNPPAGNPFTSAPSAYNAEQYNTNLSFQDMQDIGSGKVPIQMQHVQTTPQHSPHATMHHSPHMPSHPSPLSSPHLGARQSPHTPSPSPHGHSQSPQSSSAVSISSSIQAPPVAIQALADSTTKPRRRRSKKKTQENGDEVKPMDAHQDYTPIAPQGHPFPHLHSQMQQDMTPIQAGEMQNQMYEHQTIHQEQMSQMIHPGMHQDINMLNQQGANYVYEEQQQQYMNQEYMSPPNEMVQQSMFIPQEPEPAPPQRVTVAADLDEEFGHLSVPPVIPPPKPKTPPPPPPPPEPKPKVSPPPKPKAVVSKPKPAPLPKIPQMPVPMLPMLPKGPKPVDKSSFQSSFLSFIGGAKPETLSSVTNSTPHKKPALPKYAPDTRGEHKSDLKDDDDEPWGDDDGGASNADSAKDVKSPAAATDDSQEDDAASVASSASEAAPAKASAKVAEKPAAAKPATPSTTTPSRGASRGRARGRGKFRGIPRNRRVSAVQESALTEDSNDGDALSADSTHTPSPPRVTRRASSGRRAAAVSQQKFRNFILPVYFEEQLQEEDSDSDADFVATAESSEVSELDYDSDKDPSWDPSAPQNQPPVENPLEKRKRDADSDEEIVVVEKRARGRGRRGRGTPKSTPRGRGRRLSRTVMSEEDLLFESVGPATPEPAALPVIIDKDAPHKYMKGDFVVDRKDYVKLDNFPIWKIDASRLLQKFEQVVQEDGSLYYKSLSTYSSWSGDIRSQFKGIMVQKLSSVGGVDTVKLLQEYVPKKNKGVSEIADDDPMLQKFTIYVQVMISQAMEPGFLRAVTEEKDEYYHEPLEIIDNKLEACKESIKTKISWSEDFLKFVEFYPHMAVMSRPHQKSSCEACSTCEATASKVVQLFGTPYSRDSLHPDEEISEDMPEKKDVPACEECCAHLQPYHSCHHFKYGLFKRCNAKVSMVQEEKEEAETREILDQCLQNRNWVNKLFSEFWELINPYEESESS